MTTKKLTSAIGQLNVQCTLPPPPPSSTNLPTYQPTYPPTYLPTYQPTYLLNYLPTYLPTFLPNYPPTFLPTYVLTYLPTYLTTHLPSYLTTHLSTLSLEAPTTKLHHKAHLDTCCCYRIESLGLVLDRNSSFRHALGLDCYNFSISSYLRRHRFVNTD